jgi:hypothetical protein
MLVTGTSTHLTTPILGSSGLRGKRVKMDENSTDFQLSMEPLSQLRPRCASGGKGGGAVGTTTLGEQPRASFSTAETQRRMLQNATKCNTSRRNTAPHAAGSPFALHKQGRGSGGSAQPRLSPTNPELLHDLPIRIPRFPFVSSAQAGKEGWEGGHTYASPTPRAAEPPSRSRQTRQNKKK